LFLRRVRDPTGGEIKVRDYFDHCLAHPGVDPYLYVDPRSSPLAAWQEIWSGVVPERTVPEIDLSSDDWLFLAGRDWELLPAPSGKHIINLVQGVRHANPDLAHLFALLKNFAYRICVSRQVLEAIAPHAVGPVMVIQNGIPLDRCTPHATKIRGSVLVGAHKRPEFGAELCARLSQRGISARAVVTWMPRQEFLAELGAVEVFVGLPYQAEGFYLPALEAMASACAVVCADAVGNRDFCVPLQTCLQPRHDDLEGHVQAVEALVEDAALRERIRAAGLAMARDYSLDSERRAFHGLLDRLLR
jgi:glycosyltransferase involved in cell wall biosynthesis